ncbi:hypothetical protein DUI70_2966 [Streptomyces albus]|nr:hypothetical protein DUI70_2966 [Streptomyces albus]
MRGPGARFPVLGSRFSVLGPRLCGEGQAARVGRVRGSAPGRSRRGRAMT